MSYNNCSYTPDLRELKCLLKDAQAAAEKACEAAKIAEASACRAASLAKAAEEAACRAERAAEVAKAAAVCAEKAAEKVRCMAEDLLAANSGCGCQVEYTPYHNDCDC